MIFQLTASQGGWQTTARKRPRGTDISTHSLTRRLTRLIISYLPVFDISTHSLTRRLTVLTTATVPQQYISTHSLTRRLTEIWRKVKMLSQISTHSLTRRLTIFRSYTIIVRWISTHSLTRRLTAMLASSDVATLFQLTASQGGWRHRNVLSAYNFISTHSLTRRLTDNFLWVTFILEVFQLTASQGGWRIRIIPLIRVMWISTHSLTRRLTVVMAKDVWCSWYFNSQPHKEADTHVCFVYVRGGHFNSQPHKEADQLSHSQLHNLKYISTHSLTRRLTAV